MPSILDRFPKHPEEFEPSNVAEFTVLQIAKKLSDIENVRSIATVAERRSLRDIINAYQQAIATPNPRVFFQNSLKQLTQ